MEIFNIHLFEFLLIAALALIVFGPERLPEVGRFVGKQVARFLAWQQQSPELKMLNDVRAEFEQEIASLRDELVRTRKQLDLSQEVNLNQIRDELRPMLNLREQVKGAVAEAAKPAQTAADPPAAPGSAPAEPAVGEALADAAADAARPAGQPEAGHPPEPSADPAEAPAPAPDIAAPEQAAPPSPAVEPAEPAEQLLDAAPRPAPEGTVQAAARPNRLAAAEPTGALGPPDEHPALRETRRRGPLDQAAYADPPAAPGDAPAATNRQAA
ncbi:MAG TPA: twin-arginine translocase TatA/TatE family subunit, partial [Chloroflexaceae bacterium]|nr:twin-arginine translocase TatA/TatE family subunit [Chloroflexaceae bacterium]